MSPQSNNEIITTNPDSPVPARSSEQMTLAPDGRPMEEQPVWRQEFPVDWPQDHHIARRDFTKFLVLTSFAFFVGQIWIGIQNFIRRRRGRPPITRIATLSTLAVGDTLIFRYPDVHDDCVLVRSDENTLLAFSQKCTHLACAVIPRPEQNTIHCPCHAGYFDLKTGRPIAGPPRRPLPRIKLKVRGDLIYATGVEVSTT